MIKNILIYIPISDKDSSISSNFTELGCRCVEFAEGFQDEHNDADFVMKLLHCMRAENIDLVLSKGYFPLLATACEMQKTPMQLGYMIFRTIPCCLRQCCISTTIYFVLTVLMRNGC